MNKIGDKVEKIAKPIARKLGLDPACPKCEEVKELLNNGEFIKALKLRLGLK